MKFALRFRLWREGHKHISQREFARALGVCESTVNKIERGIHKPSRITKLKFKILCEKHEREKKWKKLSASGQKSFWLQD